MPKNSVDKKKGKTEQRVNIGRMKSTGEQKGIQQGRKFYRKVYDGWLSMQKYEIICQLFRGSLWPPLLQAVQLLVSIDTLNRFSLVLVLVHLGCCNKIPQTYKQQKFVSDSCRSWTSTIREPARQDSMKSLFCVAECQLLTMSSHGRSGQGAI